MYPQIRYIGPSLSTLLLCLYIESKILSITDYGGAVAGLQLDVATTSPWKPCSIIGVGFSGPLLRLIEDGLRLFQ